MHVPKGAVYGLVGPNGCGKSTIMRHIMGIYKPKSGHITIDGQDVWENAHLKQKVAFIPDELFYFLQASTLDMKKFYKGIYKDFDEELFDNLRDAFPTIDLKKNIRNLSKGMQKQVVFWLSICTRPDVMLLDEPVDGLDPVMRRQIWSILMSDVAQRGTTILVSSHNLRELEDVCDHVGIMHKGRIIIERSLEELEGSVMKIQVAFNGEMPDVPEFIKVLHSEKMGKVYTLIVKGYKEEINGFFEKCDTLILEQLPLNLEEVFIYEMGGEDYAVKDILF